MQKQKTAGAASTAAGARGGPGNGTPALKEWYTIVVYEKQHAKKAVLYVGRRTYRSI